MTDAYRKEWVCIYGDPGTLTSPIENLSKEMLIRMLRGQIKWGWVPNPNG